MMRTVLIVAITIFFSFLSLSYLQSQPPTPWLAIPRDIQQGQGSTEYTNTNTKKDITQNPPASVVPEIRKAKSSVVENDQANKVNKRSALCDLFNISNERIIAFFTVILAISTIALWWSTRNMWKSTRAAFIAANRPRLRIRHLHSAPKIIPVWVYVANVGGSDAIGIELHAAFTLKTGTRRQAPWIENLSKSIWHGPTILHSGEEGAYELRSKPDIDMDTFEVAFEIASTEKTLSVIGKVRYRDANDTQRETGFGWGYELGTGEFAKPEKDDQYNYED